MLVSEAYLDDEVDHDLHPLEVASVLLDDCAGKLCEPVSDLALESR